MSKLKSLIDNKLQNHAAVLLDHSYRLSVLFPKEDFFGPTLRLRHAASSILGHISEGFEGPLELSNALNCILSNVVEVKQTGNQAYKSNNISTENYDLLQRHCDTLIVFIRKMIFTLKHK